MKSCTLGAENYGERERERAKSICIKGISYAIGSASTALKLGKSQKSASFSQREKILASQISWCLESAAISKLDVKKFFLWAKRARAAAKWLRML